MNVLNNYICMANLKKSDIARKLNVSRQTISQWAKKDTLPDKYFDAFCDIVGIHPNVLSADLNKDEIAGDEIKFYRNKLGLTQVALANNLNIRNISIYLWETGKQKPTKYLKDLSYYLDIPPKIIYPFIHLYETNLIILELDESIIIVSKEIITETSDILQPYLKSKHKDIIFTQTTDIILPLPILKPGERRLFPILISESEDNIFIELDYQLIIITLFPLTKKAIDKIKEIANKDIILCKAKIKILESRTNNFMNKFYDIPLTFFQLEYALTETYGSLKLEHDSENQRIYKLENNSTLVVSLKKFNNIIYLNKIKILYNN